MARHEQNQTRSGRPDTGRAARVCGQRNAGDDGSTLFSAFSPEQRTEFLNDIFVRRALAGQRAAGASEGFAELEAAIDRHLARFMRETAEQFRASCLGAIKS